MFGNVISNAEIEGMVDAGSLTISPFDRKRLKLAHYRVSAGTLRRLRAPRSEIPGPREVHDFNDSHLFEFAPNEYLIVEVREFLQVPDGIVGNFLPASSLIEQGFGLTAGKLDPGFGKIDGRNQKVHFGLKNQLDKPNIFDSSLGLAHVYFVNLRGLKTSPADFTPAELRAILRARDPLFRRDDDDGVRYPAEDEY